jgi:outer membrane protein OmpA-like peptidoglycan-associated protein
MPTTPSPVQKDTVPQVVSVTPDPKTTENSTEELTTTNNNIVKENVEAVEVEAPKQDEFSDSVVKTDEIENASNESFVNDILFSLNSSRLNSSYSDQLNSLASNLIGHPEKKLMITGHSDLSGTDAINNELSKQRAEVVYQYLIKKGVNKIQITTEYKGSKELKYIGRSDEIDAANRRVSFSFY